MAGETGLGQSALGRSRRRFLRTGAVSLASFLLGSAKSDLSAPAQPVTTGEPADGTARTKSYTMTKSYIAYVGSRTTKERGARGEGINVYSVDADSGRWTHLQLVSGLLNPSFLAFDRNEKFLYTVHGDSSEISAFEVDDRAGTLAPINQESTQGKNPVHLTVDPTNRFVVVANHITSTLAVLPLNADGSLGKLTDLLPLKGKIGPHRVEQPFAKPHQVQLDPAGRFIAVPDKGLDVTFTFRLDPGHGKLHPIEAPPAQAREGAGPRHITFHPSRPFAYVLNELDSTLTACRYDPVSGRLEPFQILSSLPDSFVGNSRASEIEISADGRFVYASNRGYDSIAIFATDSATGRIASIGWQESFGKTPRFIAIDPTQRFMFVANEESDTIVTFKINKHDGTLQRSGDAVSTGSPVCIIFRPMK
jgi:6-phosphogluconolactonase